jgi:hypothetical protein
MDVADLFVIMRMLKQPGLIAESIIVSATIECFLAGVIIV